MAFSTDCQSNSSILMPSPAYTVYLYSIMLLIPYWLYCLWLSQKIAQNITLLGLYNEILGSKA